MRQQSQTGEKIYFFFVKFKLKANWALNVKQQGHFSNEHPKARASRNSASIMKEVFGGNFVTEKSCFRGQVNHSMWRLCKEKLTFKHRVSKAAEITGKKIVLGSKNKSRSYTHTPPTIIMTKNKLFKIM